MRTALSAVICMEGMIVLAKKKEESTNEKIVRLYKEGYSFDEISRNMEIPKGNIIGIVEKYFPDYQTYVQPQIDHSALEEKDKGSKGKFPPVAFLKRNKEDNTAQVTINLEMNEEGLVDKNAQQIAKMLEKGRSVAEVAEFFNREKVDVQAVKDVMEEHFKRVEAQKKPAPKKESEDNKFSKFATGLESEDAPAPKPTRPYTPPTYSKRDDPKPVSASYGLASHDEAKEEEKPAETPAPAEETKPAAAPAPAETEEMDEAAILAKLVADLPPVIENDNKKKEEHKVSLLPDSDKTEDNKPAEENKVSLLNDEPKPEPEKKAEERKPEEKSKPKAKDEKKTESKPEVKEEPKVEAEPEEEIPDMPSIELVSPEKLEEELTKAPDPVENIPEIGYEEETEKTEELKEVYPGMSALEKMKQFAQEQIALNNKKIDELKAKKTDAENEAFDCNTKVESMKKEIEEMQAKLLVLIDEKDKAGKVVSDINEEIEAINKENADYGTYL